MSAARPKPDNSAGAPVPAHLRVYVEILGHDAALDFLLEFGGAAFYLAADPKGNSEIFGYLGVELASRLVARLRDQSPHNYTRIPVAKPWIANVLRDRGMTIAAIARKLHMTDSSVGKWVRKSSTQMDLF